MRSYYSYGLGQVLPKVGVTNLTSTRPVEATTGGGTLLDAAAVRHARAVMAQRAAATSATAALPTSFSLLKSSQPVVFTVDLFKPTTRLAQPDLVMSAAQAAATGRPSVGSQVSTGGGGGGAPPGGGTTEQFAEACTAAGGGVVGPLQCQLADGAIMTVDAQGKGVCVNTVGQCAAAGAAAGAAGGKGALVIGAAALAALMFLR